MRWFLIPKIGTGRYGNLYRPKYVEDYHPGVKYEQGHTGEDNEPFMLCGLSGNQQQIDEIASKPAVEEIPDTTQPIEPQLKGRLRAIYGSTGNDATGTALIASLKSEAAVKARAAALRAHGVAGAVKDAIRGR